MSNLKTHTHNSHINHSSLQYNRDQNLPSTTVETTTAFLFPFRHINDVQCINIKYQGIMFFETDWYVKVKWNVQGKSLFR